MTTYSLMVPHSLAVLIVEDEPAIRRLLSEWIKVYVPHAEIREAETIAQAKLALDTRRFDALLLDLKLPNGEGLDVVIKILDRPRPPAIVISGSVDDETAERCLELGAQDYISKAALTRIGAEGLWRIVRYAIKRQRGAHRLQAEAALHVGKLLNEFNHDQEQGDRVTG